MTMTASRRALVAGVAALPAIAALPAMAGIVPAEPDPIFAAIAAHRATEAAFCDACLAHSRFEESLPSGARKNNAQLAALDEHQDELGDATADLALELAKTMPTTLAGCVALLNCASENDDGTKWPDHPDYFEGTGASCWNELMHKTLAAAIQKITV
jgi:hypothetical protein